MVASGAGLAYELAYYDFLISIYDSRFSELVYAYNQVFPKFDESFTDWLLNIIEFEEARTNYNETINQSVALIDETFSWKNGFISNQTGNYLEENGREQYLQLAYNESNELYVIADSQTKNAADMRQKAVDVYSSILYISVATALCGVVSGRIGSGKIQYDSANGFGWHYFVCYWLYQICWRNNILNSQESIYQNFNIDHILNPTISVYPQKLRF